MKAKLSVSESPDEDKKVISNLGTIGFVNNSVGKFPAFEIL